MRIVYDKPLQRVELIPESRPEIRQLEQQFGPWEPTPDEQGLRGPTGSDFELMLCRRESDGAVLIEIERTPDPDDLVRRRREDAEQMGASGIPNETSATAGNHA